MLQFLYSLLHREETGCSLLLGCERKCDLMKRSNDDACVTMHEERVGRILTETDPEPVEIGDAHGELFK